MSDSMFETNKQNCIRQKAISLDKLKEGIAEQERSLGQAGEDAVEALQRAYSSAAASFERLQAASEQSLSSAVENADHVFRSAFDRLEAVKNRANEDAEA